MFESADPPSVSSGDAHAAALGRLRSILPVPPRPALGPLDRAVRLAPGAYRPAGRRPAWHPSAAAPGDVADRSPAPSSAAALIQFASSELSSHDLLEVMAGWERLVSWAQARQADVIAEFARRRPGPYAPDEPGRAVSEFAADEIAVRLRITRRAADVKLAFALDLADRLPATRQALLDGRIDLAKARAIVQHTAGLSDSATRQAVEERVLRRAGSQTASELRRSLLRAVAATDPEAVAQRREKAVADRFLDVHPLPDGMAEIVGVMPAEDAMAVFTAVDAIAQSADPNDARPVQARRVDALVDLCANVLSSGDRPGRRLTRQRRHRPHIQVTVAATTLLGVDDHPGELAGYGPIPAAAARRVAADPDATWRRLLTDPVTGTLLDYGTTVYRPPPVLDRYVVARDQVCVFPGCRQPARRCDLDHGVPYPQGHTSEANLAPLCRHHHRAKTEGGWTWRRGCDGTITWTAPTGHAYQTDTPPVLDAEVVPPVGPRTIQDERPVTDTGGSVDENASCPF
jgi:hypothetical protein